ncbi:hypothetical protein TrVE_jg7321 [Triparma verrucosa]|uniref:Domain of unknown function at the cortex 1 domain-containing protein n=1 Tax=Triparma verrucosa TaxID=1606542 RepID=A0A9W7FMK4_9STRA|nr:hypothetical protein TrVE_jg7321 [Triparma verrucosa]
MNAYKRRTSSPVIYPCRSPALRPTTVQLLVVVVLLLYSSPFGFAASSSPSKISASVQSPSTSAEAAAALNGTQIDLTRPCSPIPIENPFFVGSCLPLIRGSESLPSNYDFDNEDDVLWEFQFQGRFTRPIRGPLYMSLEIPEKREFKINFFKRQIVNGMLKFIKIWGYDGLDLDYGSETVIPHLSCPIYQTADRIHVSSEDAVVPKLGEPIQEDGEETRARREMKESRTLSYWEEGKTITFSFNHTYFDIENWRVSGIPLVGTFDVNSFTSKLRLAIYELEDDNDVEEVEKGWPVLKVSKAKHRHKKKNYLAWFMLERGEGGEEKA